MEPMHLAYIEYGESSSSEGGHQEYQTPELRVAIKEAKYVCLVLAITTGFRMLVSIKHFSNIPFVEFLYISYLIYDICYIIGNLILGNFVSRITTQDILHPHRSHNPFQQDTNLSGFVLEEIWCSFKPLNGLFVVETVEKKFWVFNRFFEFLRVGYLILFACTTLARHTEEAEFLTIMFYSGLLYFSIPIMLCVSWPCLLVVYLMRRNQEKKRAEDSPLKDVLFEKIRNSNSLKEFHDWYSSPTTRSCAICHQDIQNNQTVIQLPCNKHHLYHAECCRQWISQSVTCPLCRKSISFLKE